jgi:multiple sugar transport system substrate-binding protein
MMNTKMIKLLGFAVFLVFLITACAQATETPPAEEPTAEEEVKADAGSPVKVVIMSGPEADGMKKVAEEYMKKTGNPVEIIEQGRDTYLTMIPTQLLSGTDAFDLAFIQSTMVGELAQAESILPLSPFLEELSEEELAIVDIEDVLVPALYEGQVYGLPTDISTLFLFYRSDLIPEPPSTWEETLDVARQFSQSQNADSPTPYGLAFDGVPGESLPETFYNVMWSYGAEIVDEDGNVIVDSPEAAAAGGLWQTMAEEELLPPEILSMGFGEVLAAIESGQVAMAVPAWNAAYPIILNGTSEYKDVIEVAVVPGVEQENGSIYHTPYSHSYFFALNSASKNLDAAFEFLMYATGKEGGLVYAKAGGAPSRMSIFTSEELKDVRPEFPLMLESLKIAKMGPPLNYWPEHIDAMNTALASILDLSEDPQTALTKAAEAMRLAKESYE